MSRFCVITPRMAYFIAVLIRVTSFPVIAIGAQQPAFANWQYTTWQMTPAQVIAASKGQAREDHDPGKARLNLDLEASGQYRAADRDLAISFYFTAGHLAFIALSAQDTVTCDVLKANLSEAYGSIESQSFGISRWRDTQKGNFVRFIDLIGSDGCEIQYEPLEATTKSGL